ncbi:nuclear transport factor 2 family protein [Paraburkholderia acidicola]|uniref:Nuclear transport factor 2 family protein n=1 Tax=Paraburkholderia acidicola TaxID=1912599 RepID=A0ABV1LRL6_9BURK
MHFTVNELLKRNLLGIFGERDAAARMAELKAIWQPDGVFVDPDGRHVGINAIDQRVAQLQTRFPGFDFVERGDVQAMHGVGRVAWGYGPEDNPSAVTGVDVAVSRNGKIQELYVFLD